MDIKIFDSYIFFRLLDVLAGRKDKRLIDGYVLVNGEPQPENFQLLSGFVSQVNFVGSLFCFFTFL